MKTTKDMDTEKWITKSKNFTKVLESLISDTVKAHWNLIQRRTFTLTTGLVDWNIARGNLFYRAGVFMKEIELTIWGKDIRKEGLNDKGVYMERFRLNFREE